MRVGVFSTHPIQYQVPLWRALNADNTIDLTVFYFSDQGVSASIDPGFGEVVVWDIPLLEGYTSFFHSKKPIDKINSFRIENPNQTLEEHKFDIVLLHGYTHRFARQLIRLKSKYGYKVILRGEFTEMPRRKAGLRSIARRIYLSWFYRHVDHFCPIGEDAKDHLLRYGVEQSKTTVAPYSVDDVLISRSLGKYERASSRKALGIPESDVVFLFSGKMIHRKQPLLLGEAFLSLSKRYENFTTVFLGSGEQYQALCEQLEPRLGQRFIAPGFVNQSDLGLYFTAADVFVLPSTYDTWGLVVNEAMHYGLPCVVSDKVGSRLDLVSPGETGEIFRFDCLKELENALQRFMEAPGKARSMGDKALKRIQGYTIHETVRGLKIAMEKVSNG
jgi:glycosyltransferase involved in cell wall biosynthesis